MASQGNYPPFKTNPESNVQGRKDYPVSSKEYEMQRSAGAAPSHPTPGVQTTRIIGGGSIAEALLGGAALVLSILGLLGVLPLYLAAISTIVIGLALLVESAAVASRFREVAHETGMTEQQRSQLGGGAGIQIVGGILGAILGILALVGMAEHILLPVAAIVFGASLTLGAAETLSMSSLASRRDPQVVRRSSGGAAMNQVFTGVAAAVLGTLVLVGAVDSPLLVMLIATLCVGLAVLLVGAFTGTRRMNWAYRWF